MRETLRMALCNPASPIDAVVRLADHPSMLLRGALAARPDLPPTVAAGLAGDPLPGVRAELAGNPGIDEALIRTLAHDRDHDVRRTLAHHPRVPLDVLAHLAAVTKIGPTLLPRIVDASAKEMAELAQSPSPVVRMLLAQRHDLPAAVRDALAADPDAKVVKCVAPHPGLSDTQLRAMVARHGVRVLAKVATNPDAAPALLEDLTRHRPPVRKAFREVARHPKATATALLACLDEWQARPIAARHPAVPPRVITDLLLDDSWQVVEAAAANPALPPSVMAEMVP